MKLDIPKLKQHNSFSCGHASLFMVMKYYDKNMSEENIKANMVTVFPPEKNTVLTIDIAEAAIKMGYRADTFCYWLTQFKESNNLMDVAKKIVEMKKEGPIKKAMEKIIFLLQSGIKYEMKVPSIKMITDFIDRKIPIIITVNSAVLNNKEQLNDSHFIVVTGYDNKFFYYNDTRDGKEHKININKLLLSMSVSVLDLSGYLLAIYK